MRQPANANGQRKDSGRVPPQDIQAEKGLLSSIFIENSVIDEIPEVRPDDFYLDAHQRIYGAMQGMRGLGAQAYDAVTVGDELKRRNQLTDVGGYDYLTEVVEAEPHHAHAKYYAGIVIERSRERKVIYAASDLIRDIYDGQTVDEALPPAESLFNGILDRKITGREATAPEMMHELAGKLQTKGKPGLPTGFTGIDDLLGGLQPGNMTIIAARPSVGKTALAGSIVRNVAATGAGVLFFSLEQTKLELSERFVCSLIGMDIRTLRSKNFSESQWEAITKAISTLHALPYCVEDQPRNIFEITSQSRRNKREKDVALVVVDYLQLITTTNPKATRDTQVAEFSSGLKKVAKTLGIHVIALAQLNREVEKRQVKRPILSDLRESGAIEQDADIVMFLDRPRMYDNEASESDATVIVAKNRNGQKGDVKLLWDGPSMAFTDPGTEFPRGF